MKKMISKNSVKLFICLLFLGLGYSNVMAQNESADYAEFSFYRPSQSMMSGGVAIEIRVYMNDQLIGSISNGMLFKYKVKSEGDIKIKLEGFALGSVMGKSKIINLEAVKHGQVFEYTTSATPYGGIQCDEITAKQKSKINKAKWEDIVEQTESANSPIVK